MRKFIYGTKISGSDRKDLNWFLNFFTTLTVCYNNNKGSILSSNQVRTEWHTLGYDKTLGVSLIFLC